MKTIAWSICAAVAIAVVSSAALAAPKQKQSAGSGGSALVHRGEYLVTIVGCGDCHTPWRMGANGPEQDLSRRLSGHPEALAVSGAPGVSPPWGGAFTGTFTGWAGPWGVSFAANLTPDRETGLGTWVLEEFIATMRTGRHHGTGRQLLPPMPWPNYAKMTDDDLKATFAYLQSIPAIKNKVPDAIVPESPAPGSTAGGAPPAPTTGTGSGAPAEPTR
jgi:hypothetical protein